MLYIASYNDITNILPHSIAIYMLQNILVNTQSTVFFSVDHNFSTLLEILATGSEEKLPGIQYKWLVFRTTRKIASL